MNCRPCLFSFFAGSGFLDLGFETTGFDIVYVNEIFKPFITAYSYAREIMQLPQPAYGYHQGEVAQLFTGAPAQRLWELVQHCRQHNHIIGFIGGPPCPDFSIGGKNKGYLGEHGKLSAAYIQLICTNLPDFFLFENVKGLWRTQKHRLFFESLKYQLTQSGYILGQRLINAIEYGVPQDRERIILVGFRNTFLEDIGITPATEALRFNWEKGIIYPQSQVFNYPWQQRLPFQEDSILPCPENIPQELTVEFWFRKNQVLSHPNSQDYFQPRAAITKFASIDEGDDSKKSFKRLHRWRYSPTACYGNNEVHLHPYKPRRISVAEALAIQSQPPSFLLPEAMSLTNMFKTIGNGVPYLASKALAETIRDFLNYHTRTCTISNIT